MIVILSDFVISKLYIYIYILINSLQSIDSLKKKKKKKQKKFISLWPEDEWNRKKKKFVFIAN